MTKQPTLFEAVPDHVDLSVSPGRTIAQEKARQSAACDRVLERLQQGPALNIELVHLAMNLTGRISDLRTKHGCTITAERSGDHGEFLYTLVRQQDRGDGQ